MYPSLNLGAGILRSLESYSLQWKEMAVESCPNLENIFLCFDSVISHNH